MSKPNVTKCKSCEKLITWLRTEKGKQMPVDGATKDPVYNPRKHKSHWDTCTDADRFRKKKGPQRAYPPSVTPAPMQERLDKVRNLAEQLLRQGFSKEDLQEISHAITGLKRFQNLHCTSQQTLDKLIAQFETRLNELQGAIK